MQEKRFSWQKMGTSFEVVLFDTVTDAAFEEVCKAVVLMSDDFDKKYSRFIKTSLVSEISKKTGNIQVDEDFMGMLKLYLDLYELSNKKLNPLVGFSLSDLGYDATYSFIQKETIRPTPDLKETVQIIGPTEVLVKEPVLFDFGALGKGYFVDRVTHFLRTKGMKHFLVNGSGDIFCQGSNMQIGLEDPQDEKKAIGRVILSNEAIACSGPNKRKWGSRHHIIDPLSLSSSSDIISIWVKAESAAVADALATCLFLADPKNFKKNIKFEYLMLDKDYKADYSPGFNAELFS